ncbi:MAG: S53 family peptidase [Verrucomicrobia bacterium]|nr:S53 family peptidase [Verrucomicrobiota bacterium]
MKQNFFRYLTILMVSATLDMRAAVTEDSNPVRLPDHVPYQAVANAAFLHQLDPTTKVPFTFVLPLRDEEVLEDLVRRMYDPSDEEHYGKYLTSEEFTERFAPTEDDYNAVIAYAKSVGLTVSGTHPNRTLLNVEAESESVENAFSLCLHHYQDASGRKFYAPDNDPQIPAEIAGIVRGVVGLDNSAFRRPFNRENTEVELLEPLHIGSSVSPSGPGGAYAPHDIVTAYNLTGAPVDGSGQIIALFELASYSPSDINTYARYFGLPTPQLKDVLVDGGSRTGIDAEVTLDIELALALAPRSQIYVYEGPNSAQGVVNTYNRIATDNIAKQVSTSWGLGESLASPQEIQAERAIFLQMAAHGQTIYAAAGDSGAYDNYDQDSSRTLMVDDPASQPYVIGVGGTRLAVNRTTGAYESESIWNNGLGNGAGGGGVSVVWPIPSWQANVATAYSKSYRNVPDVALHSDSSLGYAIYHAGRWRMYGGTSCAAPLWAAFTALVNQQLVAKQKPVLGFANPVFYAIGNSASFKTAFHDVTTGNNLYYSAGAGYDNASGWGSFNGMNLFGMLTNSQPTPPTPPPVPAKTPVLAIAMTHNAVFVDGQTGAYRIKVSNQGTASTSGAVNVAVMLPKGLTYKSFSGAGWSFDAATQSFTQTASLAPSGNYPQIILTVNVSPDAPYSLTPTATVSGGGSASSTVSNPTTTTK